jgi:hypothetical protein
MKRLVEGSEQVDEHIPWIEFAQVGPANQLRTGHMLSAIVSLAVLLGAGSLSAVEDLAVPVQVQPPPQALLTYSTAQ